MRIVRLDCLRFAWRFTESAFLPANGYIDTLRGGPWPTDRLLCGRCWWLAVDYLKIEVIGRTSRTSKFPEVTRDEYENARMLLIHTKGGYTLGLDFGFEDGRMGRGRY